MSCKPGQPCEEGIKRNRALAVLGVMAAIFLVLSVASFLDSRGQAIPGEVFYGDHDAVQGKRVFQAYNCMGCHTILGNGAYLGPDLTNIYEQAGPAWLEAFLPSAGGWPTGPALQVQLAKPGVAEASGASDLDGYLKKFPAAAERVHRRGGGKTIMPNLPMTGEEVSQLIAFLKYTSEMDTEGWPPRPKVDGLKSPLALPFPASAVPAAIAAPAAEAAGDADPVALGERIVQEFACTACHATDASKLVGPGWGGLHGSLVTLADGTQATADDAYLAESILAPDARVVEGYTAGTMPAYDAMLQPGQVDAIVAYLRSLSGDGK